MKIICIIPARGGSKGIPGKNIRPVGGKPLLAWSIEQARRTPQISRVFVSTDSTEIAAVARDYGAEVIQRPPAISSDTASSESCLVHALDYLERAESGNLKAEGKLKSDGVRAKGTGPRDGGQGESGNGITPSARGQAPSASELQVSGFSSHPCNPDLRSPISDLPPPDLVVFLQATSPLREADDIQRAIATLEREQADSLFSACRVEGFVWRVEPDGTPRSFSYDHLNRPRRQDAPEDLIENGSIYIFKPWVLRQFNNRLGGKIAVYRMPALISFQIDEPADLELIEAVMAYRKTEGGNLKPEKSTVTAPHAVSAFSFQLSALKQVRLLVLDFDGVLTDNRVLVTEDGKEAVLCSREDGLGLERLRGKDVEVMVLSKEKNPVVAARCRKLGLECIQGCDEKLAALRQISEVRGLKSEEISYVGNDLNDLECLRWVGLPIAVSDAVPEVLAVAQWVTTKCGGHGAVREVCEAILSARMKDET